MGQTPVAPLARGEGLAHSRPPNPNLDLNLPHSLAARPQDQDGGGRNGLVDRADARTRTGDPFITSEVLYQLSYVGGAWRSRWPV
jgi:hypothetical protein